MAILKDRHDPVRIFFRRLLSLAFLLIVVFLGFAVWDVFWKERESRELRDEAVIEQAHLTDQKTRLEGEIAKLKTERGREEALREQYEVGREGENLIVIVEPPAPEPVEEKPTFMERLLDAVTFW